MGDDHARPRFHYEVPVRFRDVDALGHVHHSLALMYVEEARASYWREVAGRTTIDDIDYVIGEVRVRYHARIMYPGTVSVGVAVTRIGGRSITMSFEVRSADGELLVSGETVQVMFDNSRGTSMDVTPELRSRIAEYEGREL